MWFYPDVEDFAATLSDVEIRNYRQSIDYDSAQNPEAERLRQAANLCRGYMRQLVLSGKLIMHPSDGYICDAVKQICYDIAAYGLLKRFSVDISEPRKKAYDTAMEDLRLMARGDGIIPESWVDEEADMAAITPFVVDCYNPHTLCGIEHTRRI